MINKLIFLARLSKVTHKHSAVIFSNRKRAFYGINEAYGFSTDKNEVISDHAEVSAVYSAMKKYFNKKTRSKKINPCSVFRNMNLFVIRYSNSNGLMMSKPCSKCQKFLKQYTFKNIFYSDENGNVSRF
jgi:hypothetical protein